MTLLHQKSHDDRDASSSSCLAAYIELDHWLVLHFPMHMLDSFMNLVCWHADKIYGFAICL
jgi:hypothetical protein